MDIPELPTDNLYKFAALVGAIVAVLPLAYMTVQITEIGIETAENEAMSAGAIAILELKQTQSNDSLDELSGEATEGRRQAETAEAQEGPVSGATLEALILLADDLDRRMTENRAQHMALVETTQDLLAPVRKGAARSRERLDALSRSFWPLTVAAALGFVYSVWGFFFWYHRVQKHQDALLLRQVGAANAKQSSKPTSSKQAPR